MFMDADVVGEVPNRINRILNLKVHNKHRCFP